MEDEELKEKLALVSSLTTGVIDYSAPLDAEPRAWAVMGKLREVCQEVDNAIHEIEAVAVARKWETKPDYGLRAKYIDRFGDIK